MLRIGLLGGTFDPPHWGHLWLAETAREQLNLDLVLFMPVGAPPHKQNRAVTAVSHRIKMVELAIGGDGAFGIDRTDVARSLPHSTASLLPLMRQKYPDALLWMLLGTDSLRDLPTWHHPEQLIVHCRLAVLPRPGVTLNWEALTTAVPELTTAVDMLSGPLVPLSSTEVREWVKAGHSVRYLVKTAVYDYIRAQNLYAKN